MLVITFFFFFEEAKESVLTKSRVLVLLFVLFLPPSTP